MTTISMTGHRPNKLWGYNTARPEYGQVKKALSELIDKTEADTLISGMALGFDQIAAEIAIERPDVRLIAAVPFKDQPSNWPYLSRNHYFRLLDAADEVTIVCDGPYAPYKMQVRNEWMVDHADIVVALWDGTQGGTANCVRYAQSRQKPIMRLDPRQVRPDFSPEFSQMSYTSPKKAAEPKGVHAAQSTVSSFRGEFYFLSNMYPCDVTFEGRHYLSAESAFQAAKCANEADKDEFTALNGYAARKLGKQVAIRPDWDNVRLGIMRDVLKAKFSEPELAKRLMATNAHLVEKNEWGDTFWGVCRGQGQNHLGKILEQTRDDLRKQRYATPIAYEIKETDSYDSQISIDELL